MQQNTTICNQVGHKIPNTVVFSLLFNINLSTRMQRNCSINQARHVEKNPIYYSNVSYTQCRIASIAAIHMKQSHLSLSILAKSRAQVKRSHDLCSVLLFSCFFNIPRRPPFNINIYIFRFFFQIIDHK